MAKNHGLCAHEFVFDVTGKVVLLKCQGTLTNANRVCIVIGSIVSYCHILSNVRLAVRLMILTNHNGSTC